MSYLAPIYIVAFLSALSWILFSKCDQMINGISKGIEVDEDLPNYFHAIKNASADEILYEHQYLRERYGVEIAEPEMIKRLKSVKMPVQAIIGPCWYQIISDPRFYEQFAIVGPHVFKRERVIEDGWQDEPDPKDESELSQICKQVRWEQSDMVTILLNLSYFPDEVIKLIDFEPGWSLRFKANMDACKRKFEQDHGRKWEWQSRMLEVECSKFYRLQLQKERLQRKKERFEAERKAMKAVDKGYEDYSDE